MRTIGGSIGYAFLNNILVSEANKNLPATIATNVMKAGMPQDQVSKFVETFLQTILVNPKKVAQLPVSRNILMAAAAGLRNGLCELCQIYILCEYTVWCACSGHVSFVAEYLETHDQ